MNHFVSNLRGKIASASPSIHAHHGRRNRSHATGEHNAFGITHFDGGTLFEITINRGDSCRQQRSASLDQCSRRPGIDRDRAIDLTGETNP